MKIVSYNFRFGGKLDALPMNPWRQLINDFSPDIILAQETLHPRKYFTDGEFSEFKGCVWAPVPGREWGSAILSRDFALQALPVEANRGWVAGAQMQDCVVDGNRTLSLYSVHAPSPGPYEPKVNAILNDIEDTYKASGSSFLLVGGDFNVTTAVRHLSEELQNSAGELALQTRLRRNLGLVNAWQLLHPNQSLPQTLRWARNPLPAYHCDAIFIDHAYLRHLLGVHIDAAGTCSSMSDHNPIVVTFQPQVKLKI